VNRCFFCKQELFTHLAPLAAAERFAVVVYGENASDVGDYRPGAQAADQFLVRAPLKETGLTKAEIRQLSSRFGLPTADKPQMACLSSRVPYGEAVTEVKLAMIEAAENVMRDLGFYEVRVRHHELNGATAKDPNHKTACLARIEVGQAELGRLLDATLSARVTEALKSIGYQHVTVDLQGYRRGSLNEATKPAVAVK
jgi:uncharacterized protein